jgi:ubiquitin carboxyl-terminal hydrolase 9/24
MPLTSLIAFVVQAGLSIAIDTCTAIEAHITSQLLGLSEDQLKKENLEEISVLLRVITRPKNSRTSAQQLLQFWVDYTQKVMQSSSLVLKLFAWDQVGELTHVARSTKPYPNSYIVSGAGNPVVNGTYLPRIVPGEPPAYVKPPDAASGGKEITLFRCNMQHQKNKWWFLSEADAEKPGTSNDIDYYEHHSFGEVEEREPPCSNWTQCAKGPGLHPPPVLVREGYFLPAGDSIDNYLISKIAKWVDTGDILRNLFGSAMHREIVARSKKLIIFLADINALTQDHLRLLWKSCLECRESDICDEIVSILSGLSLSLSPALFQFFIEILNAEIVASEDQNKDNHFSKVVLYLEKFNKECSKSLNTIPASNGNAILDLLWSLYGHPAIEGSKAQGTVENVMSFCLYEKWAQNSVNKFVSEGSEFLRKITAGSGDSVDETKVSRILQSLIFLLSHQSFRNLHMGLAGFGDVLEKELARYVLSNRGASMHALDMKTKYQQQIAKRLKLIRVYYGLNGNIKMTRKQIESIWTLLHEPCEREELFAFFNTAGVRNALEAAYDMTECVHILKSMICNPEIDWSKGAEAMYDCFVTYADGVKKVTDGTVYNLCTETVWRIALEIPSDVQGGKAIEYLLKSYYSPYDTSSVGLFLEKVFEKLLSLDASIKAAASLNEADVRRVMRCVAALKRAVDDFSGPTIASHMSRSRMNRLKVTVACKVNSSNYDNRGPHRSAYEQTVTVALHPSATLYDLKSEIAKKVENTGAEKVFLSMNNATVRSEDSSPLTTLGIHDGAELTANVYLHGTYSHNYDYYSDRNKVVVPDANNVCNLVSSSRLYMDCLFSLIVTMSSNSSCLGALWEIISAVPSQPDLVLKVSNACNSLPPASTSAWAELFSAGSSARATYVLQLIDGIIQPGADSSNFVSVEDFIRSGGFSAVLKYFIAASVDGDHFDEFKQTALSVALHTLHFCLFGADGITSAPASLFVEVEAAGPSMVHSLLSVAMHGADQGSTDTVHDAFYALTYLMRSPDIAKHVASNSMTKSLFSKVLRLKESKKVRDQAAVFAAQLGRTQIVVFSWLLAEISEMRPDENNVSELFLALRELLIEQHSLLSTGNYLRDLALCLSDKLTNFPPNGPGDSQLLLGCLELLKALIEIHPISLEGTSIGRNVVEVMLKDFLFAMPTPEKDVQSICTNQVTRKAAFEVVLSYLRKHPEHFATALSELHDLQALASKQLRHTVSVFSGQRRRLRAGYAGLKNQGCTCYSNSLLQQLFMNAPFRRAVMKTPIRASHRTTLWHYSNEELVHKELMLEWHGGTWRRAKVLSYDSTSGLHSIRYHDAAGTGEEEVTINLRSGFGRVKKETGKARLFMERTPLMVPLALSEREESAMRILEQLQRTFCFLQHSKQTYFDPRALVDACATLNLNYNVYHQNDASEFCDQFLDRLETAMKGKFTNVDTWKDEVVEHVFGGEMLYQKIPQDCEHFEVDRRECGHWQSTREESFLKVELIIRGKENIEESLSELVAGELMNGDNKIMCEKCNQKKDTTRRTCFGLLPDTLIVHLKRFDLDFQTFETVKLNNMIAFPNKLDMFKYTKEGIEVADMQKRSNESNESPKDSAVDPEDYSYDLQGVLVHSGVAQGGHYYSYIRDMPSDATSNVGLSSSTCDKDSWFKFDDDYVSPFNPDNIPACCFGGTYSAGGVRVNDSMNESFEEERSANALMLFFRKTRPSTGKSKDKNGTSTGSGTVGTTEIAPVSENIISFDELNKIDPLIDGYQAFEREVWETNIKQLISEYVLDSDFHSFVRSLLSTLLSDPSADTQAARDANITMKAAAADIKVNEIASFGCQFFLDVVLKCREREGVSVWVDVLKSCFSLYPTTAEWFLFHTLSRQCSWLKDFLLQSVDSGASENFVELLVGASSSIAAHDRERTAEAIADADALILRLADALLHLLSMAPLHIRTCDELFTAFRDLASIPQFTKYTIQRDIIARLAFLIIPDHVPPAIATLFEGTTGNTNVSGFVAPIMDAIAGIMLLPRVNKAALIEDTAHGTHLTPMAVAALTAIFNDCSVGHKMDVRDLISYIERIHGRTKQTAYTARNILDHYGDQFGTYLHLEGFLNYYAKTAVHSPKLVWKDLHSHGYTNDLSKGSRARLAASGSTAYTDASNDVMSSMTDANIVCLTRMNFYEAGMFDAESTSWAIARRVCYANEGASLSLLNQVGKL